MTINVRDLYRQGIRFMVTDFLLRKTVEEDPELEETVAYPGIVLNSFASEMFLKCLLMLDGKGESREHHLKKLYDLLSDDTKAQIKAEWQVMLSSAEESY